VRERRRQLRPQRKSKLVGFLPDLKRIILYGQQKDVDLPGLPLSVNPMPFQQRRPREGHRGQERRHPFEANISKFFHKATAKTHRATHTSRLDGQPQTALEQQPQR